MKLMYGRDPVIKFAVVIVFTVSVNFDSVINFQLTFIFFLQPLNRIEILVQPIKRYRKIIFKIHRRMNGKSERLKALFNGTFCHLLR